MKPLVIAALCAAPLAPVATGPAPASHPDPFGIPTPAWCVMRCALQFVQSLRCTRR